MVGHLIGLLLLIICSFGFMWVGWCIKGDSGNYSKIWLVIVLIGVGLLTLGCFQVYYVAERINASGAAAVYNAYDK